MQRSDFENPDHWMCCLVSMGTNFSKLDIKKKNKKGSQGEHPGFFS